LAGFVHHVFLGSSLARCCSAAAEYAQAVAATKGAVSPLSASTLESVKTSG
jgi:sugar/nucleoside kinase (ribokinase family)